MRATRALVQRRTPLLRTRAALLAPAHHPTSPYHGPKSGKQSAYQATRAGGAERLNAPAGHTTIAVNLALLPSDDALRKALDLSSCKPAQQHEAPPRSLLQPVPGLGTMLRLVWLSDSHPMARLPRGQACASAARRVKGRKAAAGKRVGTSGKNIGTAPRTWALSAAAPVVWRNHPPAPQLLARVEKKPAKGKARSLRAPTRGRAVSWRRQRPGALDREMCLPTSGRRAGAPGASRDASGEEPVASTPEVQRDGVCARHGVPRPCSPAPWRLMSPPRWLLQTQRLLGHGVPVLPLPRARPSLARPRDAARRLE
jgi:hypothetical protein